MGTDIIRLIIAKNDGDISLTNNCKFKSLPKRILDFLQILLKDYIEKNQIYIKIWNYLKQLQKHIILETLKNIIICKHCWIGFLIKH